MEHGRIRGRDAQLTQLDLCRRPREVQRALRGMRVIVAISEREQLLAGCRNERREGYCGGLTRLECNAHAQSEDRIENGTRGACQRSIRTEGKRVMRGSATTDESSAIGLEADRANSFAAGGDDVRAPQPPLLSGARPARCRHGRTPFVPFRLDKEIRERGMRAVRVRLGEDDLSVTRELDLAALVAAVGERDAPDFR